MKSPFDGPGNMCVLRKGGSRPWQGPVLALQQSSPFLHKIIVYLHNITNLVTQANFLLAKHL